MKKLLIGSTGSPGMYEVLTHEDWSEYDKYPYDAFVVKEGEEKDLQLEKTVLEKEWASLEKHIVDKYDSDL